MASYLGISHLFQMSNPCGEEGCYPPPLGNESDFGDPSLAEYAGVPPNSADMVLPFHGFKPQLKEGILVVSIILPIFLLFLTCYAILLYCRRRRRRLMNSLANRETAGGGEDIDGDNNDVVGDGGLHHVWFIRTVGLDQTTIDSIKIFPYKFGDPLIGTTNCSVCLSEFREGEDVRLLPKCSHAFHISCIDTWLGSHVNCPLCRAPVVVASPPAPLAAAATTAGLGSSSSTTVRTTSEESNPGSSEDLQNPQLQTNVVATENSANPIARECSSRSGSFSATAFRVLSDLGHLGGRRAVSNGVDAIVAPHRSFSMDFSAMGVATEGNAWQERKEASLGLLQVPSRVGVMEKQWSRRKGTCSLGMTRSASTNGGGGKILGSRFGRGRSNSFLPL